MHRSSFSKSLAMLLVATLAGCAHTQAPPPESYRSSDGFQTTRWGMTPADLGQRLDGADLVDPHTYRTREQVDGKPAQVTYEFPNGHLAAVTVQYLAPAGQVADFDASFDELVHQYGNPLPPPGTNDDHTAETIAIVVAVVLVVGLIALAIATKSGGHADHAAHAGSVVHAAAPIVASAPPMGAVHPVHAACWLSFAALRTVDASLQVAAVAASASQPPPPPAPEPPGGWMAEWRTDDTDVMLLGVELGTPSARLVLSYHSRALAPQPAAAK